MVSDLIFCQISWNSNDWIVRNRHVSAKAIGLNFSSNCACVAFNVLRSFGYKQKLKIAGFFGSLPFLTYLRDKRLKPSIHCVQLCRKITDSAGVEKIKLSLYWQWRHVCSLKSLCTCVLNIASAKARAKTVFGHLKFFIPLHNIISSLVLH